jgi:phosphoadenosine phosphosulfate reductase
MSGASVSVDLQSVNAGLETAAPEAILQWVSDTFPHDKILLTCSFQHDGVVLAHMLHQIAPEIPAVFIDTGFHFPETLAYREEIQRRFGIHVVDLKPIMPREEFAQQHGLDLYRRNPDLCCHINKVEPLRRHLPGMQAWVNGRRRDQASTRQAIHVVEEYQGGLYKVNPLAGWTSRDTFYYMQKHDIPTHPLFEQGYASIGCAPCTRPVLPDEQEREGRWAGQSKTECGLHTFLDPK